jgi:hypothetical protein
MSKGARFWGFLSSRVWGVLGGISLIALDLASFGGPNLGYGVPMRCSYYPQSILQICGANWEIGSWIRGGWPASAVHLESSGHTGQTGASHRSDQCRLLVEFCSGECLGVFFVVSCCYYFKFGLFGSSVGLFGGFGISWLGPVWPASYTDLTGVVGFCESSQVLPGCSSRDRSNRYCSPFRPLQSSGARVACSAAFSSRCRWLLVPRTSSTSLVAWSWPTWVVESETCFGNRVRLVGVLISFEEKFYRLSFNPPL